MMDRLRLPVFQERIGNDHDKYERTGAAVLDEQQFLRGESRTIAVTNHGDSALATEAYLALCACAEDSSLSGEGAAARLAQLGLVDHALFMAVAQANPAVAETSLSRTISAARIHRSPW
jgi:DNA-binding MurR/RpiR family transcriptional regulator